MKRPWDRKLTHTHTSEEKKRRRLKKKSPKVIFGGTILTNGEACSTVRSCPIRQYPPPASVVLYNRRSLGYCDFRRISDLNQTVLCVRECLSDHLFPVLSRVCVPSLCVVVVSDEVSIEGKKLPTLNSFCTGTFTAECWWWCEEVILTRVYQLAWLTSRISRFPLSHLLERFEKRWNPGVDIVDINTCPPD